MRTYRSHVYNLAMAASAEATGLALSLSYCASQQYSLNYDECVTEALPDLQRETTSLRDAVGALLSALPAEVSRAENENRGLIRHVDWIDRWLENSEPEKCTQDPVDIAQRDLPDVLGRFDEWYERQSPVDCDLAARLERLVANGELNAAAREVWAIFKTRMDSAFEIPDDLDGHKLADKLFGPKGVTVELLPDKDRKGYLNLFKGLYTLNRNLVAHNDVEPNPEEIDAVLTLVNSALVRIEEARSRDGR